MDYDGTIELQRDVATIESAFAERQPSSLSDPALDQVVSRIAHSMDADREYRGPEHLDMRVRALYTVANLHHARYHTGPHRNARFLWSAVTLFRIIRRAPSLPSPIPDDIILLLDALAADEPLSLPAFDDAFRAADTAGRLAEYAVVAQDPAALTTAEALARTSLNGIPAADPQHPHALWNLIVILLRRMEMTGSDADPDILTMVDMLLAADAVEPQLMASAGGACYAVAARTHDVQLLDRAVKLIVQGADRMPDDHVDKAAYQQQLGRTELLRWALGGASGQPEQALIHLLEAAGRTTPDNPDTSDLPAWLAMASLAGDRPDPAAAAQWLDEADARGFVVGVRAEPGILGQAWLLLHRADTEGSEVALDKAIASLRQADSEGPAYRTADQGKSLASALWSRWERAREIDDVDDLIDRLVLRADSADCPPDVLNYLARALGARWERTVDSLAIRYATTCAAKTVELAGDHPAAEFVKIGETSGC